MQGKEANKNREIERHTLELAAIAGSFDHMIASEVEKRKKATEELMRKQERFNDEVAELDGLILMTVGATEKKGLTPDMIPTSLVETHFLEDTALSGIRKEQAAGVVSSMTVLFSRVMDDNRRKAMQQDASMSASCLPGAPVEKAMLTRRVLETQQTAAAKYRAADEAKAAAVVAQQEATPADAAAKLA